MRNGPFNMEKTTLSSKGQIILPKSVRDNHRWAPGTEFSVEDTSNGVLLKPIKRVPASVLEKVAGCLAFSGPAVSLEQMDEAITLEAKERRARGRY